MKYAITFIFTLSLTAFLLSQNGPKKPAVNIIPAKPKLVVGIIIDQMRFDYVYRFWDKYGNDGFKRLVNEGYNCRDVNYNYVPTFTGPGHSSVYSGTTPSISGIISNSWYDRESGKEVYCVEDHNVKSVGAESPEGESSPHRLLVTTIGDQLRLSNNKQSKVIGIALKDRGAILPAGHTANAAYWYDGVSGKWITSTYYMNELPSWVDTFNTKKLPQKYLSQSWTTILPADQYKESLPDDNKYEGLFSGETKPVFPHDLASLQAANGGLGLIRTTPFGNSLTEDFAEATLTGEQLGKGNVTDFLCVSFSSTDYIGHMYGPQSMEIEDCYIRLDKELADLFHFIDSYIGKNNALVFLTADHGAVETPQYLKDNNIPAGYFNDSKAVDSLKKTLRNVYGDSLVLSFGNEQVFLDRKTMDAKKLDHTAVERFVADFLMGFKGVQSTMTRTDLISEQYTDVPKKLIQNGFNAQRSGDVCVILQPGWFGEWPKHTGTTHGAPWSYDTHVPLFWWGWKVKNGNSDDAHNITDVAPTVCMALNIQFPDGCTGVPITGIMK
ncbi:MAG: alkaline phosphatase family protein [Bacteroidetes bacterium]|nr:alkaline phosphatase family protein [Bacteroidota bacterium]